jgi:L-threonylcarbamoyladenylate synthase
MKTRFAQLFGAEQDVLRQAARDLARGALVGVPTECVYGLAARADDEEAIRRLFEVKGRPEDKPLARLLARPEDLLAEVENPGAITARLVDRLWPGPLTLVLPDASGGMTGFRCPDHPVALALVAASGVPVVATSANRSGRAPAVDARQVLREFDGRIEWILDGGPSRERIASTVVRVVDERWEVLRAGALPRERIEAIVHETFLFVCTGARCRSPMAAGLFRMLLARKLDVEPTDEALAARGYRVLCAGTAALEEGPPTHEAIVAARHLGADIEDLRGGPLTPSRLDEADHVLVTTKQQERRVLQFGWDSRDRVRLVDPSGEDVPDPYRLPQKVYDRTAERLLRILKPLAEDASR